MIGHIFRRIALAQGLLPERPAPPRDAAAVAGPVVAPASPSDSPAMADARKPSA